MAADFDRDNSIDRLLKGAGRDRLRVDGPGDECVDAETLAAWVDGALPAQQAQSIESHVADCARCQGLVSAFAATDTTASSEAAPVPATVVPLRSRPAKYWMPIAAGTLAASLLIWIGTRDRDTATIPIPVATSAENVAPPPPATTPAPPPSDLKYQEELRQAARSASTASGNAKAQPSASPTPSPAPVAAPPPPPAPAMLPPPTASRAMPPPPAPPPARALPQTSTLTVDSVLQRQQAAQDAALKPSPAPVVIAEFSTASLDPRAVTVSGLPRTVTTGGAGGGRGGAAGAAGGRPVSTAEEVQAPSIVYWRILAADVIQKSLDRTTWDTIAIDPPVQGLSTGVAPAPFVCWIAGKGGLVLLTIDGRQFTRTSPPSASDIVSITAIDARTATVRTVDGQSFTTSDAGKTWIRN